MYNSDMTRGLREEDIFQAEPYLRRVVKKINYPDPQQAANEAGVPGPYLDTAGPVEAELHEDVLEPGEEEEEDDSPAVEFVVYMIKTPTGFHVVRRAISRDKRRYLTPRWKAFLWQPKEDLEEMIRVWIEDAKKYGGYNTVPFTSFETATAKDVMKFWLESEPY